MKLKRYCRMVEITIVILGENFCDKDEYLALPRMMLCFKQYLFWQLMQHLNSGKRIYLSLYDKGTSHTSYIRCYKMQTKEHLPDMKLYFAGFFLIWMKEWMLLRNRRLLELERYDLKFGWDGNL